MTDRSRAAPRHVEYGRSEACPVEAALEVIGGK
jgi:hypothetical protein